MHGRCTIIRQLRALQVAWPDVPGDTSTHDAAESRRPPAPAAAATAEAMAPSFVAEVLRSRAGAVLPGPRGKFRRTFTTEFYRVLLLAERHRPK